MDPSTPPSKKRKMQLEIGEEDLSTKRQGGLLTIWRPVPVSRPLNAPQFIPYRQGTIRILSLTGPHFLAAKGHVETLINYEFKKMELLLEAMYPLKNEWARIGTGLVLQEGSYRLALVGDVVLKMAILDARFGIAELNGTTDRKVQSLVSDENLANIAETHGIASHLAGWYQRGQVPSKKAKATTVEAIIGAVWFDSGKDLEAVKKILPALLGEELDDTGVF